MKQQFMDYIQINGYNPKFLCSKFNISERTCRRWKRDFLIKGGVLPTKIVEDDVAIKGLVEKEVDKIEQKQIKYQEQENLKELSKTEFLIKKIKEVIKPIDLNNFPKIKLNADSNRINDEVMILDFSDCQIGKKTKSYNSQVFVERLNILSNNLLKVLNILRKSYNIKKLYINMLGDITEGENIFPQQPFQIDNTVMGQVFGVGLPALQGFLLGILPYFDEIIVNCVPGNHGRTSRYGSKEANWDTVMYEALKSSLTQYTNIKFNISYDFYLITEINGVNHLLMHGDQIRNQRHVPVYLIIDRLIRYITTLGNWDIAHLAHFHQVYRLPILNYRVAFINGSFDTDCELVSLLGGINKPVQNLYLSSKTRGVTAFYCIDLE